MTQRLRARAAVVGLGAERAREQRVGGDVRDQVVGREQDRAGLVEEDRVRGAVPGAVQHAQGAVAQRQLAAVARAAA